MFRCGSKPVHPAEHSLRRLARLLAPLAEAMERLGGGSSGPRLEAPELRPAN